MTRNLDPAAGVSTFVASLQPGTGFLLASLCVLAASCTGRGEEPRPTPTRPPSLVRVTPLVSAPIKVGPLGQATSLLVADESVWVTAYGVGRAQSDVLFRVDAKTDRIVSTIPLMGIPGREWGGGDMAATPGAIWIGGWRKTNNHKISAVLQRIDTATNRLSVISLDGRGVVDLAADERGMWVLLSTHQSGVDDIVLLDPTTASVLQQASFRAEWVGSILPVGGTVWVSEREVRGSNVGGGFLARIDTGSGRTLATLKTGGSFAEPVVGSGVIWAPISREPFALSGGPLRLGAIDPSSGALTTAFLVGGLGYDMAAGPDGAVWLLDSRGHGAAVDRFDPSRGKIDARVIVPGSPIALSVSSSDVWVLTYEAKLVRIELG